MRPTHRRTSSRRAATATPERLAMGQESRAAALVEAGKYIEQLAA